MSTKKDRMYKQIEEHAANLLAIFPNAQTTGIALCKSLRRAETSAHNLAEHHCNGDLNCDEWYKRAKAKRKWLCRKLGVSEDFPFVVNGDPRGYALKIDSEYMEKNRHLRLERDWGGNGLLAPCFDGE